jgi:uncharacterized protein with PQ loop repeat
MNELIFNIFGYLASLNACLMMVPQVQLTMKKGSFEDISIHMIILNLLTQCLFFPYSIHNNLYPLIIVNTMLSTCDVVIIVCYIRSKNKADNSLLNEVFVDSSQP